MGNSCLSDDTRKVDATFKQMELEQYLSDEDINFKQYNSDGFTNKHQRKQGKSICRSEGSSKFTLRHLIEKQYNKQGERQLNSRCSTLSDPRTLQTLASSNGPVPSEKYNRLQLLRTKQVVAKTKKEIKCNFESNSFSKEKQELIKKTVQILSQDFEEYQLKSIQRYDLAEIRQFLEAHNWDSEKAARKITFDIQWRRKHIPLKSNHIIKLLRSQQVLFQGMDLDLNPCLIIRPNYLPKDQSGSIFGRANNKFQKEYQILFAFILEYMLPKLANRDGAHSKISVILDFENKSFRMDIIQSLKDLIMNHYPGRLNKIFIVNVDLQNFDPKVKSKFEKSFYQKSVLFLGEAYKQNLSKFFDPQELLEDYGGQVSLQSELHKINEQDNMECAMLKEFQRIYPINPMGFNFSY